MDVTNGKPNSTADASEVTLKLLASRTYSGSVPPELVFIQAHPDNSGTLQFSFGEAVGANHIVLAAGDKHPPISVPIGVDHIRVKGSGAGQKYTITW